MKKTRLYIAALMLLSVLFVGSYNIRADVTVTPILTNDQGVIDYPALDVNGTLYALVRNGGNSFGKIISIDYKGNVGNLYVATNNVATNAVFFSGNILKEGTDMYVTGNGLSLFTGGGVYKFSLLNSNMTILHTFSLSTTNPEGSLTEGGVIRAGTSPLLYGFNEEGGISNCGTIYALPTNFSASVTWSASFKGTNGKGPNALLYNPNDGKLYGTTYQGGNGGVGVFFSTDPNDSTHKINVLCNFTNNSTITNGNLYPGNIAIDASRNIMYGTFGGGNGGIYSMTPAGVFTTVHMFGGTTPLHPTGPVLLWDGKIAIVTSEGLSPEVGALFITDTNGNDPKIYSFTTTNAVQNSVGCTYSTNGTLFVMYRTGQTNQMYEVSWPQATQPTRFEGVDTNTVRVIWRSTKNYQYVVKAYRHGLNYPPDLYTDTAPGDFAHHDVDIFTNPPFFQIGNTGTNNITSVRILTNMTYGNVYPSLTVSNMGILPGVIPYPGGTNNSGTNGGLNPP